MATQKFCANLNNGFQFENGATGYRSTGDTDILGPYAKVINCPIMGTKLKRTCYATALPDSHSTIPAATRIHDKHVSGQFILIELNGKAGIMFRVSDRHKDRVPELRIAENQAATAETMRKDRDGELADAGDCAP